jgi:hypothetical protein
MRLIITALCVCAVGCGGQTATGPTSPANPTGGPALLSNASLAPGHEPGPQSAAGLRAQPGVQLPFRGKFTSETAGAVNCPPTCPPTILRITGTATGEAAHLGRFTATTIDDVQLSTTSSTGTWNFTAANGDQLFTTTAGVETEFTPPNISHVAHSAAIVGGTGRFNGATGAFAIRLVQTIDFATNTATASGTFEGHINLNK